MKPSRLPGTRRRFFGKSTLWLMDDHLLAVEFNGYTESYKHFPYKNLQAIVARRTSRQTVWTVLLAVFAAITSIPLLLVTTSPTSTATLWTWFTASISGLCLMFLAINLLKGPTSICHLQTDLGLHELPSLHRLRHYRGTLAKLRPFVTASQGMISEARAGSTEITGGAAMPDRPPRTAAFPTRKEQGYDGNIHLALYGVMLLDAALGCYTYWHANIPLGILSALLTLGMLSLAFMAMTREKRFEVPGAMRVISWIVVVSIIADTLFDQVFSIAYPIYKKRLDLLQDRQALIKTLMDLRPADNSLLSAVNLFYIGLMSICGLCGFIAVVLWRRRKTSSPTARPLQTSSAKR